MVRYILSKMKLKMTIGVALNAVENGGGSTNEVVYINKDSRRGSFYR